MGVAVVVDEDAVGALPQHVLDAADQELRQGSAERARDGAPAMPPESLSPAEPTFDADGAGSAAAASQDGADGGGRRGRLTAVWGPTGAV